MSKLIRLEERIESMTPSKVTRHDKGYTIKDVVLLSESSKNPGPSGKPRRYGAGLQQKVKSLFEGIKVKADHPEKNADGTPKSRERSILTTIGEAQNVRIRMVDRGGRKESQIIGDLELIKTPVAEHVAMLAESMPKHAGMSITGDGAFAVGEGEYDELVELIPQTVDVVDKPATTKGFFEAEGDAPAFGKKKAKVAPKSEGNVDDEVEPEDDVVTDEPTDLEDDDATDLNADEQDLEDDEPELDENGEPIEPEAEVPGMDSSNPDEVTTAANELTDIANSEKTSQAHFDAAFAHSKAAGIIYELGNVPRAKAHKDKAAEHDLKAVQLKTSEGAKAPQMPPDGKPQQATEKVDKGGEAVGSKTEGVKPKPKVLESAPDWVQRVFLDEGNDNHGEDGRFTSGEGGGSSDNYGKRSSTKGQGSGSNSSGDNARKVASQETRPGKTGYGKASTGNVTEKTKAARVKKADALSKSAFQASHETKQGKEGSHDKAVKLHAQAFHANWDAAQSSADGPAKDTFRARAEKHKAAWQSMTKTKVKESCLQTSPDWVKRLFTPVEEYADGRIQSEPYSYSPTKSCDECAKLISSLKLELASADGAQKGYLEKAIKAFEASKEAYEDGSYSLHKDAVAAHGAALARALTDDQNALHVKMVNRHANRTQESIQEGNENHDENGRFESGEGSGGSASGKSEKKTPGRPVKKHSVSTSQHQALESAAASAGNSADEIEVPENPTLKQLAVAHKAHAKAEKAYKQAAHTQEYFGSKEKAKELRIKQEHHSKKAYDLATQHKMKKWNKSDV